MKDISIVNGIIFVVSLGVALATTIKMFYDAKHATKFKITRKDNGKSTTISSEFNKSDAKKLADLF